jgi:heptosyltransferase-2
VVSYPTFRLALLMFLSGIPVRVGTGYRWYSFLFNRRVYEHRKTAEKHELEYNLSLLSALGVPDPAPIPPSIVLSDDDVQEAARVAAELGLTTSTPRVVLHPGSGGSAREWSAESFGGLGMKLAAMGYDVVVTGGPGEDELVHSVVKRIGVSARAWVNRGSLKTLGAFIRDSALFVSNSTGPLHIAAAVGTPVIGLYPPILACSPTRWGPYTHKKAVFVPDARQCPRCRGGACRGNDCLELITVDQVLDAAQRLLAVPSPQSVVKVMP